MVALKLDHIDDGLRLLDVKQERRGGIETDLPDLPPGPLNLKQERRGGIETAFRDEASAAFVAEAGTPWWH